MAAPQRVALIRVTSAYPAAGTEIAPAPGSSWVQRQARAAPRTSNPHCLLVIVPPGPAYQRRPAAVPAARTAGRRASP